MAQSAWFLNAVLDGKKIKGDWQFLVWRLQNALGQSSFEILESGQSEEQLGQFLNQLYLK